MAINLNLSMGRESLTTISVKLTLTHFWPDARYYLRVLAATASVLWQRLVPPPFSTSIPSNNQTAKYSVYNWGRRPLCQENLYFPLSRQLMLIVYIFLLGSAYLSLQLSKNLPPILNTYTLAVSFIAIASILVVINNNQRMNFCSYQSKVLSNQ